MKTEDDNKTKPVNKSSESDKNGAISTENEKISTDDRIRKAIITTSIISFIILLLAGLIAYSLYSKEHRKLLSLMEAQKTTLTDKVTARDSEIIEWITTFDEIEKNIAMIKEKGKIISVNSSNNEIPKDKKLQVLEDIKYINTLLDQNRNKIASLTAQLTKSGGAMKVLQKKIDDLELSMKQNESEISELKTSLVNKNFEVDQLNIQMTVLQDTMAKMDNKITNQTFELNKAFYVCGTFKELKAKGLLTKEGGFIGLGKTKSLTGNFSDNAFEQIDLTVTNSIPVNAKSAKLISEHPTGSYELLRDNDKKVVSIEIKDPALFWKISKYAVVEITR
jgi:uncharacterized coiled-coil protein SlyX